MSTHQLQTKLNSEANDMKKRSLKVKNKYSTKSDTRVTSSVTSGIAPPETTQPTRTGFNSQTRSGSLGGRYSRSYWAGRKQWDGYAICPSLSQHGVVRFLPCREEPRGALSLTGISGASAEEYKFALSLRCRLR